MSDDLTPDVLRQRLEEAECRAEQWRQYADRLRCPHCNHERGPILHPKGLIEDGYECIYVCPCDCHADVSALRAERDALRRALAACHDAILELPADHYCATEADWISLENARRDAADALGPPDTPEPRGEDA